MGDSKTEELKKMVVAAKEIFKIVDQAGEELRGGERKSEQYYRTTLDSMTGCFTYLYPRFKKLEALKTNGELGTYVTLKNDSALKGEKFTDAAGAKEASLAVQELRLARNIFDGYQKAAENVMNTCKRQIGAIEEEKSIES